MNPEMQPLAAGTIQAANLPPALRSELLPALQLLVERHHPERASGCLAAGPGGSASRRSDGDLLVMGLGNKCLVDAYDAMLEAMQDCPPNGE
jgi:hypothetical protein